MKRFEILTTMAELKLYGMKAAYDGIIGTAAKPQHEPQHVVGHLLMAEINEKQARSIRYQMRAGDPAAIRKVRASRDAAHLESVMAQLGTGLPAVRRMRPHQP